ncbi:MAG: hypothetical protein GY754_21280 [bacterium]|nr:hypothetical protein [bacterium]
MKKLSSKLFLLILVFASSFGFVSCFEDENSLSMNEAKTVYNALSSTVSNAVFAEANSSKSSSGFSLEGISISSSKTDSGHIIAITFKNFSTEGFVVNGELIVTVEGDSSDFTAACTGTLAISGDISGSMTWDLSLSVKDNGLPAISGTVGGYSVSSF